MPLHLRALLLLLLLVHFPASSQSYQPRIEPAACPIPVDKRLVHTYGYLVVPENRQRPRGRQVKVPFLFVRQSTQSATQHVSLYSTGGPGYSTTANLDSIGYQSGLLKYGGVVLVDQRGTRRAQPCLECAEVPAAIKQAYRMGLSQDSLVHLAATRCRQKLASQGIDLSAYTTLESAEDINDLRCALRLDSLNLLGISYSGGLMLTVLRTHPEAVRCLLLNSPLPSAVNYEEGGLLNVNEALEQVFTTYAQDSVAQPARAQLRQQFRTYFTAITGKTFTLSYAEPGTRDSIRLKYTKAELLDAIVNRLTREQVQTLPAVIQDIVQGHHRSYVREQVDQAFAGDPALSLGMRYSIYCSEQLAYADPALEQQQAHVLPWLAGYPVNNVTHAICRCWQVKPEPKTAKRPVYSAVPVLLTAGELDPWCRPFYNQLLQRTLPNSQCLRFPNRGHAPGYSAAGIDYAALFLAHPKQKLQARSKEVRIE
jgi:pimeloyl-ACP methyl ester carboxylesterase